MTIVVSRDGSRYVDAAPVVRTMQQTLDDWSHAAPKLAALRVQLGPGELTSLMPDPTLLDAPLPRATSGSMRSGSTPEGIAFESAFLA
jgi:fumarylacetoacetate (FAA) hydrolase